MRVLSLLVAILVVSASHASAGAKAPVLSACTIPDVARAAECGTVSVPENRDVSGGRRIDLYVVRLKATTGPAPDPILFFAGGPGQGAATLAAGIMRDLDPVAPDRDIIFIDQRGTGRSHLLTCDDGFLLVDRTRLDEFRRCRETLEQRADLSRYGTRESADDAADVIRALGYSRVNVIGASYGTRLALSFMERYPTFVRTAVLRAVAPHGFNILADGAMHSRAALAKVVADCAAETACREAFPTLPEDFVTLRTKLQRTAQPINVDQFNQTLYALLLSTPTRQMIPWLVHTGAAADPAAIASIAKSMSAIYKTVAIGAYLSVVCGEDAPYVDAAAQPHDEFGSATALLLEACKMWPVKPVARGARPSLNMPSLVVSGDLDPAMPPSVGERALQQLPRGSHLVVPATAHGPLFPGCATELTRTFITSGGAPPRDTSCLQALTTPPFRTR